MSYTPRVGARAELAKALKTKRERATAVGIIEEDLDVIATEGDNAREADRVQKVQLAEGEVALGKRSEEDANLFERGDALRDRLPAAILSLTKAGHADDAKFLSALSFARFRMRDLPMPDPTLAEDPLVKKVERREREDKLTRLDGLANLTATLLTRENIVNELTRRGMDRAALTALSTEAAASARAGKNTRAAAEATAREEEAVEKQKAVWIANHRMIRKAVQGDEELEKLYAEC